MPPRASLRLDENQEKEIIETALAECGGRISGPSGAATKLGIPRQTLESKITNLGIIQNALENLGQIRVHSSWEFATTPKLTASASEFQTNTVEQTLSG